MILHVLLALAALEGAAGVILLAVAAHAAPGAGLDGAATLLLIHALAAIAGVIVLRQGLAQRCLGLAASIGFLLGAALFTADIATRALAGHRLFPGAAPTGGTLLILSWLGLSLAALWRRPPPE